mgnify:CR=1 FL=1
MKEHSSATAVLNGEPHDAPGATRVHHVTPLHYHRLRTLAECAAGLEHDTDFAFTPDGNLEITSKPQAGRVAVPARGKGKYPRNVVRLHTAPGEDGRVEELRLEAGIADAVFWSDSAVHKFVVPYVASCACHDAPQKLGMLISAWNYYPADRVTVHALAHVLKDGDGIPLAIENRIHVIYAERRNGREGTILARLPLSEFVKAYPSPQGGSGGGEPVNAGGNGNGAGSAQPQVAYRRGGESDRGQRPDYTVLRALAEHACALATEPQYFMFKAGEHGFRHKTTTEMPELEPGDLVIPAYTPTVPPQRPRLHGVWCDSEDGGTANLAAGSDAMFWSDGAIEQFMLPYYASKGGLQLGLRELTEMTDMWSGEASPGPDGVGNQGNYPYSFPSRPKGSRYVVRTSTYAIVHLSTSQYVEENAQGWWWSATAAGQAPPATGEYTTPIPHLGTGDPYPPSGSQMDETYHTVSYLSPRRDTAVLFSQGGVTQVIRGDGLTACSRRGPA